MPRNLEFRSFDTAHSLLASLIFEIKFEFSQPTHGPQLIPFTNVGQALRGLSESSGNFPNYKPLTNSDKVIARYRLIPEESSSRRGGPPRRPYLTEYPRASMQAENPRLKVSICLL